MSKIICLKCKNPVKENHCNNCNIDFYSNGDIDCFCCTITGCPQFQELCGDCDWGSEEV